MHLFFILFIYLCMYFLICLSVKSYLFVLYLIIFILYIKCIFLKIFTLVKENYTKMYLK